jgi:hypothetical protein
MAKLYVIVDAALEVDSFLFLQPHDGAAMSYFYNWCLMQNHRTFSMYTIGEIGYLEEGDNQYAVTNVERKLVCVMPTEEEENEREKQMRARKLSA